jgi:two-component system sensor histidine kinase RegB
VEIRLAAEGHWVRIEIHDQGPGMPADVLERAGEPFFTTKGGQGGMGLGLFLARSVVERLGGRLRLSSVPRKGTTAIVELPTATMTQPSSQTAAPQSA